MSSDELRARCETLEAELRLARTQLARVGVDPAKPQMKPGPIFVGGTGRSGTWVMGRLIGQDSDITCIRTELGFHASRGGFRSVLEGKETPQAFTDRVFDQWWSRARSGAGGNPKGLFIIATGSEVKQAGNRFVRLAEEDLPRALATYMHDLVDPFAVGRGATRWAETTPLNASQFDVFSRVFPRARMINMVRDGRDVAASVVKLPWGPTDWGEAVPWWENRVRAADQSISASDSTRVATIRLEEMVHLSRDESLKKVVELVEAEHQGRVRSYFERAVKPEAAHVGRWRHELDRKLGKRLDREYRERYEVMAADGVSTLPLHPDAVDELAS